MHARSPDYFILREEASSGSILALGIIFLRLEASNGSILVLRIIFVVQKNGSQDVEETIILTDQIELFCTGAVFAEQRIQKYV